MRLKALGIFLFAFLVFAYHGFHTGFWCDEINWFTYSGGTFAETLHALKTESGPHGPLDLILISLLGKFLIPLGLHPHIAMRVFPVFCAAVLACLPYLGGTFSRREKFLWAFFCALSVPLSAMAVTARPIASMILFSGSSFFLCREILLSDGKPLKLDLFLLVLFILQFISGLGHPYTIFGTVILIGVTALSLMGRSKVGHNLPAIRMYGLSLAVAFLSVGMRFVWFYFIKVQKTYGTTGDSLTASLADRLVKFPWYNTLDEAIRTLSAQNSALKVTVVIFCFGLLTMARKDRKEFWLCLIWFFSFLIFPVVLDSAYGYFFAPRQVLGALPVWIWVNIRAVSYLADLGWQKTGPAFFRLALLPLIVFAWFGLLRPYRHFLMNEPLYTDIPRYRLHEVLFKKSSDIKVLVLSSCHLGAVQLYRSRASFDDYFRKYVSGEHPAPQAQSTVLEWTSNAATCSGFMPEKPDNPELLKDILPENLLIIAPVHLPKIPASLAIYPCITEVASACQR